MTAEARICPRCSSPMVLRTAKRGNYVGQQFWGCSTYPKCRAVVGIAGQTAASDDHLPAEAGASAQQRYERERKRRDDRARERWPLLVGLTVIGMVMGYLLGQILNPWIGLLGAAGVAIFFMLVYFERSPDIEAWFRGAQGERQTGRHLAELEAAGFIVHHDRRGPGYGGNIDHIAVGPTGIWVIETKSYRGEVSIVGDRLQINEQPRDRIIDQVYREAVAVQIAMGEQLSEVGITIKPVLCLHRAKLGWFSKSLRGVDIVDGRRLAKLLREGPQKLTDAHVQAMAGELDRLFPPAIRTTR